MVLMPVILSMGVLIGGLLLIYGLFFLKNQETSVDAESINMIKQSVEDADTTLSNINSVSSLIIEEIDIKYKELLFLYQMMEDKKKEIFGSADNEIKAIGEENTVMSLAVEENEEAPPELTEEEKQQALYEYNLEMMDIGVKMDEIKKFPHLSNKERILEMVGEGMSVTDIAKELEIGKGEVQLIIGLSRVGVTND
jgi:ATP/maltotriose-dependent transcriptional regulator MalT